MNTSIVEFTVPDASTFLGALIWPHMVPSLSFFPRCLQLCSFHTTKLVSCGRLVHITKFYWHQDKKTGPSLDHRYRVDPEEVFSTTFNLNDVAFFLIRSDISAPTNQPWMSQEIWFHFSGTVLLLFMGSEIYLEIDKIMRTRGGGWLQENSVFQT